MYARADYVRLIPHPSGEIGSGPLKRRVLRCVNGPAIVASPEGANPRESLGGE